MARCPVCNRPMFDREYAERVAGLYQSGATMQEVGDSLGITRARVHQILMRLGCPRRPRGRRPKVVPVAEGRGNGGESIRPGTTDEA